MDNNLNQGDKNCIFNLNQRLLTNERIREELIKMGYSGTDLERNYERSVEAYRKLKAILNRL